MSIEGVQPLHHPSFRVGIAGHPHPEDPYCDDEQAAIERASRMAAALGFNVAVAVWDERDEPLHLFMLGEHFRRV